MSLSEVLKSLGAKEGLKVFGDNTISNSKRSQFRHFATAMTWVGVGWGKILLKYCFFCCEERSSGTPRPALFWWSATREWCAGGMAVLYVTLYRYDVWNQIWRLCKLNEHDISCAKQFTWIGAAECPYKDKDTRWLCALSLKMSSSVDFRNGLLCSRCTGPPWKKNAHAKGTETSEDKQEILRSPDAWAEMDSQNQLTSDGETCWVRFV